LLRKYPKAPLFTWLTLLFLCLSGCGYELVHDRGISAGESSAVYSISVPIFKNKTYEPQVPSFFTEAFSRELVSGGLVQINKAGSEATLQGSIDTISTTLSSLSGTGLAVEKQVSVTVSLKLTRSGNAVRSWSYHDTEAYIASNINLEDFNRRAAIQRIATRVARRFHAQLVADR
jgi:outer membrane lipopolysaccharide assembly protein LptE/RlpB